MRSWVVPAITVAAAFVVGLLAGGQVALAPTRRGWEESRSTRTLGSVLSRDQQRESASAYLDPARAISEMNQLPWEIENVPAPFVGSIAEPGDHGGVMIDRRGLRASHSIEDHKPPHTFRVFLTGGSNAFGAGILRFEDTLGGMLETRWNAAESARTSLRYEVAVLANPTWSSTYERIAIENVISELHPDLVIALTGGNDVYDGLRGEDVLWSRDGYESFFRRELAETRGKPFADDEAAKLSAIPIEPSIVAARFLKNQRLASMALRDVSTKYVIALQPFLELSTKPLTARESQLRARLSDREVAYYRTSFRALAESLRSAPLDGVMSVDLSDAFGAMTATDEVFLDQHHNADRGNRVLAARLVEATRALLP